MKKRALVLYLIALFVVVSCIPHKVIAAEAGELTLAEAINLAKANNYSIRKQQIDIAKVKSDIEALLDEELWGPQGKALEKSLKVLQENLESSRSRMEQTVEDMFNVIISICRQIEAQEDNIRRVEERYAAEQILVRYGLSTTTSLDVIALAIEKSRHALDNLIFSREVAYMNLNALLARPVNTAFSIPLEDPEQAVRDLDFSPEDIDWEESLSRALKPKHGSLKHAIDTMNDAQDVYDDLAVKYNYFYHPVYRDYRYANLPEVRQAKHTLDIAVTNFEQALSEMQIRLRGTFQAVNNAARLVEITRQELEMERMNLLYAEKKYEVGLATQATVIDQLNKVTSCEIDLADKIFAYKRAILALRQAEQGL